MTWFVFESILMWRTLSFTLSPSRRRIFCLSWSSYLRTEKFLSTIYRFTSWKKSYVLLAEVWCLSCEHNFNQVHDECIFMNVDSDDFWASETLLVSHYKLVLVSSRDDSSQLFRRWKLNENRSNPKFTHHQHGLMIARPNHITHR